MKTGYWKYIISTVILIIMCISIFIISHLLNTPNIYQVSCISDTTYQNFIFQDQQDNYVLIGKTLQNTQYVLKGNLNTETGVVVKTDTKGKCLSHDSFVGDKYVTFTALTKNQAGDVFVSGNTVSLNNGTEVKKGFILKLGGWTYVSDSMETIDSVTVLKDGNIIAMSGKYVTEINDLGELLWTKSSLLYNEVIHKILETNDGFIAVGDELTNNNGIINFYNNYGDSLNRITIYDADGLNSIIATSEGDYLAVGNGYIYKIDENGNKIWDKKIYDTNFNQVIETKNGNFLAVGNSSFNDGFIYKFTSDGKELFKKRYTGYHSFMAIIQNVNNDYTILDSSGALINHLNLGV